MSNDTSSLRPELRLKRKAADLGFWCGTAAFFSWFGMGLESVLRPFQDNRREVFWAVPFVVTVATFFYVHSVQRRRSRTEFGAYLVVLVASALVLLGNIGLQYNIKSLESLGFPGGALVWLIGLVCFGIGTIRAGVLPLYCGWALILLEPASILAALALRSHHCCRAERTAEWDWWRLGYAACHETKPWLSGLRRTVSDCC